MSTAAVNGKAGSGKAKAAGGAGAAKKGKSAGNGSEAAKTNGAAASTNGTSTPSAPSNPTNASEEPLLVYPTSSKPDRDLYNQEQEKIKGQLAAKQAQLDKVKQKIADSTGHGPAGERRKALRAEQGELRTKTAGHKDERNSTLNQIKSLQEGMQKKIKDMQGAKSKTSYKSTAEIDARIKDLEKQVESGTMRLVDEKRALSEISDLRKSRKTFDGFGTQQDGIDADKAKIEELRNKLDNSEYKGLQERYTAIQTELDDINKELDSVNSSRDKLYDERNRLNEEVNVLWGRKKESAANFKEANDKYFTRVNDERAKRIERQQAERRAYEDEKRKEINERLLEEARMPAFALEIEDCTALINYFSRFTSSSSTSVPEPKLSTVPATSAALANVPQLELRKVEDALPEGTLMKKKGGDTEDVGGYGGLKKGKKGKKGQSTSAPAAASSESATSGSTPLNVPFGTVAALLQFNISPPLSRDEVSKTVDALKEKKAHFEKNQDRVTKERTTAAEARIAKAEAKNQASGTGEEATATADAEEDATVDATADGVSKLQVEDAVSAEAPA